MNYIDELWNRTKDTLSYEELKALEGSREPASKPFRGPVQEVPGVSPQEELTIEADAKVQPIEYPPGYTLKMDTSEILRENENRAINDRRGLQNEVALGYQEAADRQKKYGLGIDQSIERLRAAGAAQYEPDPTIEAEIRKASQASEGVEVPGRDMMSELILSLSPAIFAAIGGENAAISAPKAADKARAIFDSNRKEEVEAAKLKKDQLLKRYETLLKLKESGSKAFQDKQKLEFEKIQAELKANETAFNMGQQEKLKSQDVVNDISKDNANAIQKSSKDIMDNENIPMIEAGKAERSKEVTARAGIRAAQSKPPSEGERKAASTLASIKKANQAFESMGGPDGRSYPSMKADLFGVTSSLLGGRMKVGEFLNDYVKDPAKRRQIQAESNWIGAKLRNESGAAIGLNEYIAEANTYFPRKGDDDDTIAQKAEARKQVELNYLAQSGRAPMVPMAPPVKLPPVMSPYRQKLEIAYKAGKITKQQYEAGVKAGK